MLLMLRHKWNACVAQAGFELKPGSHPIVPIMLFDAALASEMAQKMLQRGIFVVGFSYPVRGPTLQPAPSPCWGRVLAICVASDTCC